MPDVIEILKGLNGAVVYAALFFAAAIEYVFPPFPGDLAVLFGVFLAVWRGESAAGVFLATLAGSLAGAAVVWRAGRWLQGFEGNDVRPGSFLARIRPSPENFGKFTALVDRYGPAVIMANRFFPGIRAFFILAAGMAGITFPRTMVYAAVSAALWNGLLFGAGMAAGDNWDRLVAMSRAYSAVALAAVSVIIGVAVGYLLFRRKRARDGR